MELSTNAVAGGGYDEFWRTRRRYRVVKGGRASKKSRTAALWYIVNMMKYPDANLLVVRRTYNSIRGSCYAELVWAIRRLGVTPLWKCTETPYEMTYLSTGQKIYFRGLDDPLKITSVTAARGKLCWLWVEEAFEIASESDFDVLDECIRGEVPQGLFKQTTLTFNPWSGRHWLKKRFFDRDNTDVYAVTTTYLCNEWLDAGDIAMFERMRRDNPQRYRVAGLGEWGVETGLVFPDFREEIFDVGTVLRSGGQAVFGLDFGYMSDPTAFCGCVVVNGSDGIAGGGTIYVFAELYGYHWTNRDIYDRIAAAGYAKERIYADSAEPKSIDELYRLGLPRISKARKGADSVNHGIQAIRNYSIVVAPHCVNFLREISGYTYGSDGRAKGSDHLMDAFRYAAAGTDGAGRFSFA